MVDEELVELGRESLEANHAYLEQAPNMVLAMLRTCDLLLNDPREVVIAGDLSDQGTQDFLARLRGQWPTGYVVTVIHEGNAEELLELVPAHVGKVPLQERSAAYVCRFGLCEAPVTTVGELKLKE
jgi:uncharacterized protein YyaL (SSP411 family)